MVKITEATEKDIRENAKKSLKRQNEFDENEKKTKKLVVDENFSLENAFSQLNVDDSSENDDEEQDDQNEENDINVDNGTASKTIAKKKNKKRGKKNKKVKKRPAIGDMKDTTDVPVVSTDSKKSNKRGYKTRNKGSFKKYMRDRPENFNREVAIYDQSFAEEQLESRRRVQFESRRHGREIIAIQIGSLMFFVIR